MSANRGLKSPRPGPSEDKTMTAFVLWLLVIAVGAYLLVAMLRPDKF